MSSEKKYELLAKNGEYEQNGEKKARWENCGFVFQNDNGKLNAKINCLPVGKDWDGWLSLFPPREYSPSNTEGSSSATSSNRSSAKAEGTTKAEDLPF